MKKSLPATLLLTLFLQQAYAQFPNPALLNTASNAAGNGTLAVYSNDLNWTVSKTSVAGPFVPAKSAGNPYPSSWMVSPYSNANWISYPNNCPPVWGWPNSPGEHSCHNPANLNLYYRLIIDLPATNCSQPVSTPSAYCLTFDFYADNCLWQILVNGNVSYTTTNSNPYYNYGFNSTGKVTVPLCNFWQPGSNTVIVHVKSGASASPAWEGLLAQANQTLSSTGAPIQLSLTPTVKNISCFGLSDGTASVAVSGAQGPFTYSWHPKGGTGASASGLSPGIYTVTVKKSDCAASQTILVTQPAENFAVHVQQSEPQCAGSAVSFTAWGASSYTWVPGNITGSVVTVSPNITTVYTAIGSNSAGCLSTKTFTQQVLTCTGLTEQHGLSFVIQPNPASSVIGITGLLSGDIIEVYELTGKMISSARAGGDTGEIGLDDFHAGVYLVKVTRAGQSRVRKFIVAERD